MSCSGFQWPLTRDLLLPTVSGQNEDSATVLCWHSGSLVISHSKTSWWSYLMPFVVAQVRFGSVTFFNVISGHVSLFRFLLISSYWNEIERWGWSHCVQLLKTYRLIYILILFGHHLALRERVLRSKFDFDLWELNTCFDASRREKKDIRIIALPFFVQIFFL